MPRLRRTVICLALAAGTAAAVAPSAAARSVHIRGTAYEFNNVKKRLAGARISVAENPSLSATAGRDGSYDLVVGDHARVTPFITAPGYHSVYLQTFATDGEDLAEVNFQTPTDAVAGALASLLHVPVDENTNPDQCVIVSTFSTKNVRGVSFDDFTGYGAHGVAGATATASPALPAPTYFNASVIPDPAQVRSSKDGGVIWPVVPTGRYRLSATAPGTRFASFSATCAPGRIVNANPPWGLHELATDVAGRVTASWTAIFGGARLDRLTARGVPARARVTIACAGPAPCVPTTDVRRGTTDLRAALGRNPVTVRAGRSLEVRIAAPGFNTRVVRWDVHAGARPEARTLCVPLGNTAARRSC